MKLGTKKIAPVARKAAPVAKAPAKVAPVVTKPAKAKIAPVVTAKPSKVPPVAAKANKTPVKVAPKSAKVAAPAPKAKRAAVIEDEETTSRSSRRSGPAPFVPASATQIGDGLVMSPKALAKAGIAEGTVMIIGVAPDGKTKLKGRVVAIEKGRRLFKGDVFDATVVKVVNEDRLVDGAVTQRGRSLELIPASIYTAKGAKTGKPIFYGDKSNVRSVMTAALAAAE